MAPIRTRLFVDGILFAENDDRTYHYLSLLMENNRISGDFGRDTKLSSFHDPNGTEQLARAAVIAFQKQQDIIPSDGTIDARTARLLNLQLVQLGVLKQCSIQCNVNCDSSPIPGVICQFTARGFGHSNEILAEGVTDGSGRVEIQYFVDVVNRFGGSGLTTLPLIFVALAIDSEPIHDFQIFRGPAMAPLSQNETKFGFIPDLTESLTFQISRVTLPSLSEFNRLNSVLKLLFPQADQIIGLDESGNGDLSLVSHLTQWPVNRVAQYRLAIRLSKEFPPHESEVYRSIAFAVSRELNAIEARTVAKARMRAKGVRNRFTNYTNRFANRFVTKSYPLTI